MDKQQMSDLAVCTSLDESHIPPQGPDHQDGGFLTLPGNMDRMHNSLPNRLGLKDAEMYMRSIRRKDVMMVKSIQQSAKRRKLHEYTNRSGVSTLESAVLSGSVDVIDAVIGGVEDREAPKVTVQCMLFSIRENNIMLLEHLLAIHKRLRRRTGVTGKLSNNSASGKGEGQHLANGALQRQTNGVSYPLQDPIPVCITPPVDEEPPDMNKLGHQMFPEEEKQAETPPIDEQVSQDGGGERNEASDAEVQFEDAQYSADVTPLVLAAQLERREMIDLLLREWTQDIHPISKTCLLEKNCIVCEKVVHGMESVDRWPVETCRLSLELLRALSSPAYILEAYPEDPILEAFRLNNLANLRRRYDSAFSKSYDEIIHRCSKLCTDLISLCRTTDEIEILLNRPEGLEVTNAKGNKARFPRLQLAIHYSQKEFVVHPMCQQVLKQAWSKGKPDWVRRPSFSSIRHLLYILLLLVTMPVNFAIYLLPVCFCCDTYKIERYIKEPVGKFFYDTIAYAMFVVLLVASVYQKPDYLVGSIGAIEWVVFLWIIGLTIRFGKMVYFRRGQLASVWSACICDVNWPAVEFLVLFFFWFSYILRFVSFSRAYTDQKLFLTRSDRSSTDAVLFGEIFYGLGCIFAVLHLFTFCKASPLLGPLQVTLKRTVVAFVRFFFIFLVIIVSFSLGMTYIYTGYSNVTIGNMTTTTNLNFISIRLTMKTLFWSVFGYGDPDTADINMEDQGGEHHAHTEMIGYIILGIYHIISIIVLTNLLIAMVANAYNSIEENADTEWKFVLTQLRMSYFNEFGCVPPPLNVFGLVRRLIVYIRERCNVGNQNITYKANRQSITASLSEKKRYWELRDRLYKRYWKQRAESEKFEQERENTQTVAIFRNISDNQEIDL